MNRTGSAITRGCVAESDRGVRSPSPMRYAEHDHDDRQAREVTSHHAVSISLCPSGDQLPERRRRWLDPEAEERQRRLDEDRRRNRQRRVDDDQAERVREDVFQHDLVVAASGLLGCFHVFLLAERRNVPRTIQTSTVGKSKARITATRYGDPGEIGRSHEQHGQARQRQEQVGDSHQEVVQSASPRSSRRARR